MRATISRETRSESQAELTTKLFGAIMSQLRCGLKRREADGEGKKKGGEKKIGEFSIDTIT